ncbi:MAG: glycine--tRNA ligase [Candidatus Babeliaceae bacterium]|nr:glycine--tRNA ligase [Candidatus Babeliaceae bacterium]
MDAQSPNSFEPNKYVSLEKLVSLCKRRGFIFQSAEIYGGVNGLYDSGPLGTLMKQHIRKLWGQALQQLEQEVVLLDGSLIGPEAMWKASGHISNFHDPMVDCLVCKHRFRADDIDLTRPCTHCGNKQWTEVRNFNLMFTTQVGANTGQSTTAYLRPETAQAIFVNFKNVFSTARVKIPFGIAQQGKAFRNEITPKQFLFRMREFEQMELEWFCKPTESAYFYDFWRKKRMDFMYHIGITPERLRMREHSPDELSHYSRGTSDIEYHFVFGWKELEGIAHRGDFDLTQHMQHSGKDLKVYDEEAKESYTPHVVECSVGLDRLFLTLLFDAYYEDEVEGETRTVLRLHPAVAPITAAILPLTKKQHDKAHILYKKLKFAHYSVEYDLSGSIGKRYRRQDEIGTPFCITFDFDSETDDSVTIRHRDSMKQERIKIDDIQKTIDAALSVSFS